MSATHSPPGSTGAATVLMLAADALVFFRGGRMWLHASSSTRPPLALDAPMLVGWLCQFARPTDVTQALARLGPADRAAVEPLLARLQAEGVLVTATAPAPAPATDHAHSRELLKGMARSVYELACDLHAMGPYAETALAAQTGLSVERRLLGVRAGLEQLRAEVLAQRAAFLNDQLAARPPDPASLRQVHIGCGPCLLEGWTNIDVYPAPLSLNVLWGLPFEDHSVDRVYVSHLLEHLFYPRDVAPFLAELRRVLRPGGVLRLVVPDIEACIEAYQQRDATFFASRRESWPWWPEDATRLEDFLAYAGAGPEPGYLFEAHKYGYDFETLQRVLERAGFGAIRRCAHDASPHPALRVDHISTVASARYGERHYSLFVEACTPA